MSKCSEFLTKVSMPPGFNWSKIYQGDSKRFQNVFSQPGRWQSEPNAIALRQGRYLVDNKKQKDRTLVPAMTQTFMDPGRELMATTTESLSVCGKFLKMVESEPKGTYKGDSYGWKYGRNAGNSKLAKMDSKKAKEREDQKEKDGNVFLMDFVTGASAIPTLLHHFGHL